VIDPVEEEAIVAYRCARAREALNVIDGDITSYILADFTGENPQQWADRIYGRLGALHPRDLALMVVLLLHPAADEQAKRLWSGLHTMTPEDIRNEETSQ
jgi:hypothetical protein